jgi:hypothetical protein
MITWIESTDTVAKQIRSANASNLSGEDGFLKLNHIITPLARDQQAM